MGLMSWFTGRAAGKTAPARRLASQQPRRHTAVEIVPGDHAGCAAVRALSGQRFLGEEAPRLPLADCDQPECSCSYRHHEDRRDETRRATDLTGGFLSLSQVQREERRNSPGRRARDKRQR
jgi:hypothetical protein